MPTTYPDFILLTDLFLFPPPIFRPGEHPPYDARYILRPETVESLFIAFRLTGNQRYRDYGWSIFQAIEKHCKVETGGYASILNVDENPAKFEDKMETFFMVSFCPRLLCEFWCSASNTEPLWVGGLLITWWSGSVFVE